MTVPTVRPDVTVNSSAVAMVGYNDQHSVLAVEYANGDVYNYTNVPDSVYDELIRSSSIGAYVRNNIRDKYDCRKIED